MLDASLKSDYLGSLLWLSNSKSEDCAKHVSPREPSSENCLDLIFAAPLCEKVIIAPYKLYHICTQKIPVGYAKSW